VLEKGRTRLGVLSAGDFFGELAALLPPPAAGPRPRLRSAYCVGETQLGMLDHDDLLALRRESSEVNEKVCDYTNGISAFIDRDDGGGGGDGQEVARLSLMDPFPELNVLSCAMDRKLEKLRCVHDF